jgi:hypothetical protein
MLFALCDHSMRIQYISITAARRNRLVYRDMRLGKFVFSRDSLDDFDFGLNVHSYSPEYRA